MRKICLLPLFVLLTATSIAQDKNISVAIDDAADKIETKTIAWRRDFHEHPFPLLQKSGRPTMARKSV
jgi:hypothetical protein